MRFLEIRTEPGKPVSMGILPELRGPFVRLGQHVMPPKTWDELIREKPPTLTLSLEWGTATYQRGLDGSVEKCAYHYDTSD